MLQNRFQSLLKKKSDAAIIASPENRRYLTGFSSTDGFLVVTENSSVFFTDNRYIEAAKNAITVCECRLLNHFSKDVGDFLKSKGITHIFTESDRLTLTQHKNFKKLLPFASVSGSGKLDYLIDNMRIVKTENEASDIIKAQRIAEEAFSDICDFISPGVTEREIGLRLDFYMLSHGAEALSFETIAISGKNTSMPHGVPSDKKVQPGDLITMDYGAVFNGYHSDMTRTVCLGNASAEQREIYNIVLNAQNNALSVLKPGLPCAEADRAARSVIEAAGYGYAFGHGTGHGVGIEIHELPNLSPRSKALLQAGNVVTIEPGIYLPGKFGVRIEDMAFITKDGYENLTKAPKVLIEL